jgi:large subunit ribosomal protein L4
MAKIKIHDRQGKEVGTYEVEPTDFAPRINKQLLHDVVVMYQSNQRQGSTKTKTRGEVAGSTKKMYRQKGTGNARAGSRRSGIRRGGGHINARSPRDWSYRLPRKAVQLATRMAIASKIRDNEIVVIDQLDFAAPKTRDMAAIIKALGCDGQTLLVTTESYNVNVYKSARNIERVSVAAANDLNALAVLHARTLLVTKAALDGLKERAASQNGAPSNKSAPLNKSRAS